MKSQTFRHTCCQPHCWSTLLWIDCGVSLGRSWLLDVVYVHATLRLTLSLCAVNLSPPPPSTFPPFARRRCRLAPYPPTSLHPSSIPTFCFVFIVRVMVCFWHCYSSLADALATAARALSSPSVPLLAARGVARVTSALHDALSRSFFFHSSRGDVLVLSMPHLACELLLTRSCPYAACGYLKHDSYSAPLRHVPSLLRCFLSYSLSSSVPHVVPPYAPVLSPPFPVVGRGGYAYGHSAPGHGGRRVGVVGWRRVVGRVWRSWRNAGSQPGERLGRPVAAVVFG